MSGQDRGEEEAETQGAEDDMVPAPFFSEAGTVFVLLLGIGERWFFEKFQKIIISV